MSAGRKNIMLGTAGHVDHGKTALVRCLTGCETDRLAEEQRRGLTIELGFAPCTMADERITGIADVPGHVDFIKNMVAAAHGIDVVILVVAADDGVMPQTREHLDILTLMGTARGLVAMTKVDLVEEDLREIVAADIRAFAAGTFLEGKPVCPVSSVTGEGFDAFFDALNAEVDAAPEKDTGGIFRLWVEKSFSIHGHGTVVTGIPTAGAVGVGDRLHLLPGDETARVRKMEVYGRAAETGRAGECVALNLADAGAIERGTVLAGADLFEPVSLCEAKLRMLTAAGRPLKDMAEVHLHVGTAEAAGRAALLEGAPLAPGGTAFAQLRLARPVPAAPGDRFVLRGPGPGGRLTTIGGGRICGISNKKLKRRRPRLLESLRRFDAALDDPAAWLDRHLAAAPATVSARALARAALVREDEAAAALAAMAADGTAVAAGGDRYLHRDVVDAAGGRVRDALAAFHDANPRRGGADPAEIRAALGLDPAVFAAAVAALADGGAVEQRGRLIALPGTGAALNAADRALRDRLERMLADAGYAPPRPDELAAACDCDTARAETILQVLCDEGTAVRLDRKVVMHAGAVQKAARTVRDLFAKNSGFETVAFRDALGVSRKYAVPLLDYFDTIRLTHRSGSRRTPGSAYTT